MKGSETRERIFRAAMQLASRDGLLTLTLENVAAESGLSKGGVMHHFATKEALLSGVIMHFTDQVEREMTRLVAEDPHPHFRWVRAMLNLMSQEPSSANQDIPSKDTLERFMLSVLAATVHNPELAKPVLAIGQRLRGRLTAVPEEGLEQLILWLVMDGLFLWQFVGMLDARDPLISEVHHYILNRIDHHSPPTLSTRSKRSTASASTGAESHTKTGDSATPKKKRSIKRAER